MRKRMGDCGSIGHVERDRSVMIIGYTREFGEIYECSVSGKVPSLEERERGRFRRKVTELYGRGEGRERSPGMEMRWDEDCGRCQP